MWWCVMPQIDHLQTIFNIEMYTYKVDEIQNKQKKRRMADFRHPWLIQDMHTVILIHVRFKVWIVCIHI